METINFIDRSKEGYIHRGLDFLCQGLGEVGVKAQWFAKIQQAEPGAILLLHDPEDQQNIPPGCRVLGQRCLDRRERLVLAERCGLPVVQWQTVNRIEDIPQLFDLWQVDDLVAKADWSYGRRGIKRLTRQDWQPFSSHNFNKDADIFMRILNGSPDTHKIDLFYDQPIACRHMFTRSLFDHQFYKGFTQPCELGTIPAALVPGLKQLGKVLMNHGEGLSGVDIMFDEFDQPWVIELNTSSLGREGIWNRWREPYLQGYLNGIKHWLADGCPATFCQGLSPLAAQLDDRCGGRFTAKTPKQASHEAQEVLENVE